MDQQQIDRVQTTWALLAPHADQVAMLFFDRLFEIAPEWKARLEEDLIVRGRELMPRLTDGVHSLRPRCVPRPPKTDAKMAAALLWTVEKGLGDDFTKEVREAWELASQALSPEVMQAASVNAA